ncbi:MAG: hypothetical protein H9806_06070 [Candidatus Lactobacillus pullistercoris]|uniref:Uncharacterized protein n=1 Tax=Candidatus Lactobacillus pullistercoris TaxID=2838636 RepID=A0A9E2NTW1_9LACO|nr:hypothetical protein [Candidatus Lactobacillus pullistercoris]
MTDNLVKLTLNYDLEFEIDEYYIGRIKEKRGNYLVFEAIDDDTDLGGISIFKNGTYKVETKAPEIDYYQKLEQDNLIKDRFDLKDENKEILSWQWKNLSELLKIIYDEEFVINIQLKSGNFYSGAIEKVTSRYVYMWENTDSFDLEECATVIPLKDISTIDINEIPNVLYDDWYDHIDDFDQDYGLTKIHLAYQDDKLFKEFPIIGKIIKEDENQILFHRLNVMSQIDAVTVINKKQIAHMSDTAVDLPYYNFLLNNNKTKGTFDPHHLLDKSYDMTYELKENDMVTLDDVIYGRVTGIIKKKKNDSFVLKEIRDYAYKEELELKYSDIISVDLNSNDLFNLKSYRNFL